MMADMVKIVGYYWDAGVRSNALTTIDEQKQSLRQSLVPNQELVAEFYETHKKSRGDSLSWKKQ